MRKWILIGALALAAIAGWQFLSPWMAIDSLRDAAREGDSEDLQDSVDFPALRESVKRELHVEVTSEAESRGVSGGLAERGMDLFASGLIGALVDNLVTPKGLSSLLVTGRLIAVNDGPNAPKEIDWGVSYTGFDSFRAFPKGEGNEGGPSLIFRRSGLSWKLIAIDIPDPEPAAE